MNREKIIEKVHEVLAVVMIGKVAFSVLTSDGVVRLYDKDGNEIGAAKCEDLVGAIPISQAWKIKSEIELTEMMHNLTIDDMPEFSAGRVNWDEAALDRDRARMRAPLDYSAALLSPGVGLARRVPIMFGAKQAAKQQALAQALRQARAPQRGENIAEMMFAP